MQKAMLYWLCMDAYILVNTLLRLMDACVVFYCTTIALFPGPACILCATENGVGLGTRLVLLCKRIYSGYSLLSAYRSLVCTVNGTVPNLCPTATAGI